MSFLNKEELIYAGSLFSTIPLCFTLKKLNMLRYQFIPSLILLGLAFKPLGLAVILSYNLLNLLILYNIRNNKYRSYIISWISLPVLFIIMSFTKYYKITECSDFTSTLMCNIIQLYWLSKDFTDEDKYIDIINYLLSPASIFAGPPVSFNLFINREPDTEKDELKTTESKIFTNENIYSKHIKHPLMVLLQAITFLVIHLYLRAKFTYSFSRHFHINLYKLVLVSVAFRCKFYFVWKLAQFNFNSLGYDNVVNINPFDIELASTIKDFTNNWNIYTNAWLRESTYNIFKSSSIPLASLITFFISSFYHGPNVCYALLFITASLSIKLLKNNTIILQKIPLHHTLVRFIIWLQFYLLVSYLMVPFINLKIIDSFKIWKGVHYYGHCYIFISCLLMIQRLY